MLNLYGKTAFMTQSTGEARGFGISPGRWWMRIKVESIQSDLK